MGDSTMRATGWMTRIEALIAKALSAASWGIAYRTAARFWELAPVGGADQALTTNAFVIVTGATTPATFKPTSTGRVRVTFFVTVEAGANADTLQAGVSVGAASVVPVFETATPITVPANSAIQVSGSVDLDQPPASTVFPLGVPAVINLIVAAATANRLTIKGNSTVFSCQEIQ